MISIYVVSIEQSEQFLLCSPCDDYIVTWAFSDSEYAVYWQLQLGPNVSGLTEMETETENISLKSYTFV